MPKRKREEEGNLTGTDQIEDQALRIKVQRLIAKIDQGIKSLTSALKLARGFERQKLGRRQKAASAEPHVLLRLRGEVIFLKQLDLYDTAKQYLHKQLVKTKRIKESPVFIKLYGEGPKIKNVTPGAEANVVARLFNSEPVKKILPGMMADIYKVLGIPLGEPQKNSKDTKSAIRTKEVTTMRSPSGNGFEQDQMGSDESEAVSNSEFAENQDASISASDDASNLVRSEDDYESDEDLGDNRPAITSTAFLPSLGMGGYYSGSESGDNDGQYDNSGPPRPLLRKNRRGQQARQRLAELKFGKKANHLEKQSHSVNRDAGWDTKRGAVGSGGGRRGQFEKPQHGQGARVYHDAADMPASRGAVPGRKHKDNAGSLHPSWEAAKLRKMQTTQQVAFSGKKITFD